MNLQQRIGAQRGGTLADAALLALLVVLLWGHVVRFTAAGQFVLLRDAVSTPQPPLSDAALGIGPYAARAVPQDGAMWALQKGLRAVGAPESLALSMLVVVALVLLGWAGRAWAAQVVPRGEAAPLAVRAPAIAMAVWNPYVVERLLQGHWSLLLGVAAAAWIPLLLVTSTPARSPLQRTSALVAVLCLAAWTPTGVALAVAAVVGSVLFAVLAAGKRWRTYVPRRRLFVAGVALCVAAVPVTVSTVLGWGAASPDAGSSDAAAAVAAFAARAEPGLGTFGSLIALGGMWNAQAVPESRSGWTTALLTVPMLLVVFCAVVLFLMRIVRVRLAAEVAIVQAGVAVLAVTLAATVPGQAVLSGVIDAIPAAGLLRDTQKWVGLAVPGACVAVAIVAHWLSVRLEAWLEQWHAAATTRMAVLTVFVGIPVLAVPICLVPDAPSALRADFRPVTYGPGWESVNRILAAEPATPTVLVLPAGSYRSADRWAEGRPVLDPAPRILDATVLSTGDLFIGNTTISGEGSAARTAEQALLAGVSAQDLAALGVDFVLNEHSSAGDRGQANTTLQQAQLRFHDKELSLWELPQAKFEASESAAARPEQDAVVPPSERTRLWAIAAHGLWGVVLCGAVAASVGARLTGGFAGGRRQRRQRLTLDQ